MTKTILLLLSVPIFFLSGCQTSDSPCLTRIQQADLNHPIEKLSDIVQDIDFVKLEDGHFYTNLAGKILLFDGVSRKNFKAYPSGYLLLSPENQIDVYSPTGKFRFTFGQRGKGPGEYTQVDDFCHDPFNNRYYIASLTGLYAYDSAGHWLYTRPWIEHLPAVEQIEASSPNTLMAGGAIRGANRLHPYFTLDTAGHVHAIPYYYDNLKKGRTHLNSYDNRSYCILNDSIFRIDNDSLSLHRCFLFSAGKPFSLLYYNENETYGLLHAMAGNIPEVEYLYLLLSKDDKNKFHLISSKTQDDCFLNLNRGVYGFVIDAWSVVDDKLLVTIPAATFRDLVEKAKDNPEKYPYFKKAKEIADSLTDDSNSVIARVTLKRFS